MLASVLGRRNSKRSGFTGVSVGFFLAGLTAVLAMASSGCGPRPSSPSPAAFTPPATGCVAATNAAQQDVDPRDSPEKPWRRTPGNKVNVYFENQGLSDRYWNSVKTAADIWSRSSCIQALAVSTCPRESNCVAVKQRGWSLQFNTDGEFAGQDRGQYRTGGTITLYTRILDKESDNGALATIVHEMGHALGLVHRNNKKDVMNAKTDNHTDVNPDAVDFANLLAIYGNVG